MGSMTLRTAASRSAPWRARIASIWRHPHARYSDFPWSPIRDRSRSRWWIIL